MNSGGRRYLPGVALLALACSSEPTVEWRGTVDTLENGAIHVSNLGDGLWGPNSPWQVVVQEMIGTRLDSGPQVFGEIGDLEVDAEGRIYVLDRMLKEVKVFDSTGSYVMTVGRSGGGPGEFGWINGMEIDSAGRLWVLDPGNLRFSVFDARGTLVEEYRRPGSRVRFVHALSTFSAAGDLYEQIGYRSGPSTEFGLARYDTVRQDFVDTLNPPPVPEGTTFGWFHRTLTGRGWWQAVAHTYRVDHIALTGDTIRTIERALEAECLSPAERDSVREFEERLRERDVRGAVELETTLRPIFRELVVDDRGYLWVMLTPEPEDSTTRFDVFDALGRHLGEVKVPHLVYPRLPIPVIVRGDRMYYVTTDELDVPYVVVARIRGRKPG